MSQGRDPWGWVEQENGQWYRYFSPAGKHAYLESLSLQRVLAEKGWWLLASDIQEHDSYARASLPPLTCLVYPWEWSWSAWKKAALTTLAIQREALSAGFSLRDATPLNLTYEQGQMRWFDQLSLGTYEEGRPWSAYPEFVSGFLAPLLLMAWRDRRLGQLLLLYPQGLPLDLVYSLLPFLRRWHPTALIHIQAALRFKPSSERVLDSSLRRSLSRKRLLGLIDSLQVDIEALSPRYAPSPWEGYEAAKCPYPPEAEAHKKHTVARWIERVSPQRAMDIGAHVGTYTHLLADSAAEKVIAVESDVVALDQLARTFSTRPQVYPIWADIAQPSPAVSWGGMILPGLLERLRHSTQLILALAITHHLRLRGFLPFEYQAGLFAQLLESKGYLIVEYVPPEDPQVRWLHSQPEMLPDYSLEGFLQAFLAHFSLQAEESLPGMDRRLFLFQRF